MEAKGCTVDGKGERVVIWNGGCRGVEKGCGRVKVRAGVGV